MVVVVAAFLALGVTSASAAPVHSLERSFGAGQLALAEHSGIAIDDPSGDVYVADTGDDRVAEFEADGTFVRSFGSLTAPTYIAVDNSGVVPGPVYVANGQSVAKFAADGTPVTSWGSGGVITGLGTQEASGSFPAVYGIAVGPEGDLFVATAEFLDFYEGPRYEFHEVTRLAPDGTRVGEPFNTPRATAPAGLAADSSGGLYKVNGNGSVSEFGQTGKAIKRNLDPVQGGVGVGVDLSNDDLYVVQRPEGGEPSVNRFEATCGEENGEVIGEGECEPPAETFGGGLTDPQGIAIDSSNHDAFVTDSSGSKVLVFNFLTPPVTGPADVSTREAVTFNGEVEPEGQAITECFFEYGPTQAYGAIAPCKSPDAAEIDAGATGVAVHATVSPVPGGDEHYRLVVKSGKGTGRGTDRIAHVTGKPQVISESAAPGAYEAGLAATLNSGNLATTYRFEYGETGVYGRQTVSVAIAASGTSVEVGAVVSDLVPGRSYHFRLIAENAAGTTVGPDQTFSSLAATGLQSCPNELLRAEDNSQALPDCRAYERVTPAFQNGGHIVNPLVLDESRIMAGAFGSFAGTQNTGVLGSQYEFARLGSGWSTVPISPPATEIQAISGFGDTPFTAPDGATVQVGRTAAQPEDADELFLDRAADLTRIGPATYPGAWKGAVGVEKASIPDFGFFFFQDATPDLSHVLYQLKSPPIGEPGYLWPFDATDEGEYPSLYEYAGTGNSKPPLLVGVTGGQNSHDLISACGTSLGAYGAEADRYNALSADGSTIFFSAAGDDRVGACPGPIGAPSVTELYGRIAGETPAAHTVKISEPTKGDCSLCQTVDPETGEPETELKEAVFQGASEDGSKVFFLTEQELLPGNPGNNLYEYDFAAPVGQRVTSASHLGSGPAGVLGVVRVSEDGSRIYFVATAHLTSTPNSTGASAQAGAPNLYVFDTDTGRTDFVAALALPGGSSSPDENLWSEADRNRPAEVTPDGRFLVFASHAQLTPDDASSVSQLFRYDAQSGELVRVSIGSQGFNENGNSSTDPTTVPQRFADFSAKIKGPPQKLISDDGSRIFFESTAGLTPKALDHAPLPHSEAYAENIYEWHEGEVSLISDGRDRGESFYSVPGGRASSVELLGTSGDGSSVFFTTADPLVSGDQDTSVDIYTAAALGGFPNVAASSCSAESCQSSSPSQEFLPSAGTSTFVGPPNPERDHPRKHHRGKHHRGKHHRGKHHRGKRHQGPHPTKQNASKLERHRPSPTGRPQR